MAYDNQYKSGLFLLGDRDFILLIEAAKVAGLKTYGFFDFAKTSKEFMKVFDFRFPLDVSVMKSWVKASKTEKPE